MKCLWATLSVTALLSVSTLTIGEDSVTLKPGSYRITSHIWIDGKEIMQNMMSARNEMLERARAHMSAAERAELDRALAEEGAEDECIAPGDATLKPSVLLQKTIESMREPPWQCTFKDAVANTQRVSLSFDCKTSAGALSKGQAKLERTKDGYRSEVISRSHVIDDRSGKPLSPKQVDAKGVTTGQWVAAECTVDPDKIDDDLDAQ